MYLSDLHLSFFFDAFICHRGSYMLRKSVWWRDRVEFIVLQHPYPDVILSILIYHLDNALGLVLLLPFPRGFTIELGDLSGTNT